MPYNWKPPKIEELTLDQQAALYDPNSISVAGGPGTGKSVVVLWRHIRNHDLGDEKSLLLTFTKTLAHYLSISAKEYNEQAGIAVRNTLDWLSSNPRTQYEIIIDEAQDLSEDTNRQISQYSQRISFGADDQQILDPKKATGEKRLKEIFLTNPYPLSENFRNSYEILRFCNAFFPDKLIPNETLDNLLENQRRGNKPMLVKTKTNNQDKAIRDIINLFKEELLAGTHNLAVLVPLRKDVDRYKLILESLQLNIPFSFYRNGLDFNGIENIHLTTFKSAKGLEFDTVIIPEFQYYDHNIQYLTLAPITENDYYVGFTRARRNLYLLTTNIQTRLLEPRKASTYNVEEQ